MFRLIITALLAVATLSFCADRKANETMSLAESLMEDAPDSALAVIESIDTTRLAGKAQRARYSLLYSMALDKNYIDTTDTRVIMPAVRYYNHHGTPDEKMKSLYYLGRVQYNAGEYNKAIVSYTEASKCSGKSDDDKYIGLVYNAIGMILCNTYSDIDGKSYYEKALNHFLRLDDHAYAQETLLYIAYYEAGMRHFDKADSLYRSLLSDEPLDNMTLPSVLSGYALMLLDYKEPPFDKVDSLFSRQIELFGGLDNLNQWCAYSYSLAALGKRHDSKAIMEQIYPRDVKEKGQYDYWCSRIADVNMDFSEAYSSLTSAIAIQDSLMAEMVKQPAANVQRDFLELYESASLLKSERRKLVVILVIAVAFLILSSVTVVLLCLKMKLSKERDDFRSLSETASTRAKQAEAELRQNKKAMAVFSHNLSAAVENRFGTLGIFKETLVRTEGLSMAKAKTEVFRSVQEQVNKFFGDKNDHEKLEEALNLAYDNVIESFKEDFPKIKKTDLYLFIYLVAGFDTTSIVRIMSASSSLAIYTRKMRLKKRILESGVKRTDLYMKFL